MHVSELYTCDINGLPKTHFFNETAYWRVKIVDNAGNPVSGATVTTTVTQPGISPATKTGTTGVDGVASFQYGLNRNSKIGTWPITVTNVTKTGWTYNAAANVVTTITFQVP
jgi:hypothetical protein